MWSLERFLPFVLAMCIGIATASLFAHWTKQRVWFATHPPAVISVPPSTRQQAQPELYVLSTDLIDENIRHTGGGKTFQNVEILSPVGAQYTPATPKYTKQGVLQLRVKFEADGTISEITPLNKRHLCGRCLLTSEDAKVFTPHAPQARDRGNEVIGIDPNSPQSRELTEAAVKAVKQIKFIPFQSEGRFVSTHGLVECVFPLGELRATKE